METERKKLTKNSSVCGSYQIQLMGWKHLIIFTQIVSSNRRLIQDNAGRRTFSTFFKKNRILCLMTFNFENTASHKYVVQRPKRL